MKLGFRWFFKGSDYTLPHMYYAESFYDVYYSYESAPEKERKSEIMLNTGLKDKNGVEIYEGDIVTYTEVGGFEVLWCYELLNNLQKYSNDLLVLGNIYENPELATL